MKDKGIGCGGLLAVMFLVGWGMQVCGDPEPAEQVAGEAEPVQESTSPRTPQGDPLHKRALTTTVVCRDDEVMRDWQDILRTGDQAANAKIAQQIAVNVGLGECLMMEEGAEVWITNPELWSGRSEVRVVGEVGRWIMIDAMFDAVPAN